MSLAAIDWILISIYLSISAGIAYHYSGQAGKNLGEFFLGGRRLPWYILGISMVATTFAADTPLAVSELVSDKGISGNWLWWNMMIGGMLTTFFFARLWRRSGVMTEVEFIDLRYSGKEAWFLRGFKAVYLGAFMNILVMGWVNVAMMTLLEVFFGVGFGTSMAITGVIMLITAVYSSMGGLMGVAITDVMQFGIAMVGSIVLAIIVLNSEEVGGMAGLQATLADNPDVMNFFPSIGSSVDGATTLSITAGAFLAHIGIQWWASWYPGGEPGGGGYIAQRMMAAKTEKDSFFATLFFQIAHYAIRPWPWIIVGLCSIVLYSFHYGSFDPELVLAIQNAKATGIAKMDLVQHVSGLQEALNAKPELAQYIGYLYDSRFGYVYAMRDFLPAGLKGLLLVAFLAAYMSTISTQLNWGASYLINDLYKPFFKPRAHFSSDEAAQKDYVWASRLMTLALMGVALAVTTIIGSISGVWAFMIECGAGLGLVLILRWYWWRINAWSEIAATLTPFVVYGGLKLANALTEGGLEISVFPNSFFITVSVTTVVWILVTLLTPAVKKEKLESFYSKVRPGGAWGPVAAGRSFGGGNFGLIMKFGAWISAIVMTYSVLFAMGKFLLGDSSAALMWAGIGIAGFVVFWLCLKQVDAHEEKDSKDLNEK